nr:LysR family transcriptional regulator [Rhizobium sp. L1K21]
MRLELPGKHPLGPGKAQLLKLIQEHGSISAAGSAMNMSYRRAWMLVDELNAMFLEDAVAKKTGGKHGGGAELTEFGATLLARYEAMEAKSRAAIDDDLKWLSDNARPPETEA